MFQNSLSFITVPTVEQIRSRALPKGTEFHLFQVVLLYPLSLQMLPPFDSSLGIFSYFRGLKTYSNG
jgi:hypothetical protein